MMKKRITASLSGEHESVPDETARRKKKFWKPFL
jgi:hypothetical protein